MTSPVPLPTSTSASSRRLVGEVYEITDVTVSYEYVPVESTPPPDPPPPASNAFLDLHMAEVPLYYGHDPAPATKPYFARSLSINGCDDDRYVEGQPCPTTGRTKHLMNREAVGIGQSTIGAQFWAKGKPGQSIGARLKMNPKDYLNTATPNANHRGEIVTYTPLLDLEWKLGTWHSFFQVKHITESGNAAWNANIELPWYEEASPQVPRVYWTVNKSQGVELVRETRVPFQIGTNVLTYAWDMKPTGGAFTAWLNGTETVHIQGRTADDSGNAWLYPAIWYGDKWKEGVRSEHYMKSIRLSVPA